MEPSTSQDVSRQLGIAELAFRARWSGRRPAFLLDVNGTLVDFGVDYDDVRRRVREHLEAQGVTVRGELRPILEAIERSVEGMDGIPHRTHVIIREGAYDIIDDAERAAAATATEVPGARELLGELGRRGLRVGLYTRNEPVSVRVAFERLGLPLPAVVVGRGDVPSEELKPDPRHPLEVLRRLEASAEDAILVGNSMLDVRAGKDAGIWTVLLWDKEAKPEVLPDLRIASLDVLIRLIRQMD